MDCCRNSQIMGFEILLLQLIICLLVDSAPNNGVNNSSTLNSVASRGVKIKLNSVVSERMKILQRYGKNIPKNVYKLWKEKFEKTRLLKTVPQHVINKHDVEYLCTITIGTSPFLGRKQTFTVIPDTGSSTLWVPSATVESECETLHKFNKASSTTFKEESIVLNEYYADGTYAYGHYASDTVTIGDTAQLSITNQLFGLAEKVHMPFCGNDNIDGILGLGFSNEQGIDPPILTAWKQRLLDKPLFTIWLSSENYVKNPNGQITYGGFDTEHCKDNINYHRLTGTLYWQFRIQAVNVNSIRTKVAGEAISDTGTSFLIVPQAIADWISVNADATMNYENDIYWVKCNTDLTIGFEISNHFYNIHSKNLILPQNGKDCILAIGSIQTNGFAPFFVLGDPFIRQFCQVHNMKDKKIGFARSLTAPMTANGKRRPISAVLIIVAVIIQNFW